MNSLCFIINSEKIYLEQVLVSFNETPMLFICRSPANIPFAILCIDIERLSYLVARTTDKDILDLVSGMTQMRDIFINSAQIWSIETSDAIEQDIVRPLKREELDDAVLPISGALYEIVDSDVKTYKTKIESAVFDSLQYESIREHIYSVDSTFELSINMDTISGFNKIISQIRIDPCVEQQAQSTSLITFSPDAESEICVAHCQFDDSSKFKACPTQLRAA